ncbi:hypothetical protein LB518_03860 [Mesorhizobium sp. BR1-1-16]|uniref:hypothetical protein n=1 Tax=Mesorhizobium sp. BR1-1-16 TaxID=2876653 RepID=UPI001CC9306D|nr:hypothetical protein [Mesorhizobium sp. BR1-1-16]MBZ9935412.1 hypothetical protein [Mesorhizobium sp. BR1-1-16]
MTKSFWRSAARAAAALAIAAPLLAPIAGTAHADGVSDTISALDPSVQDLRIAGSWEKDGRKGVYRLLVARTAAPKPTARLFVQWIATGVDGSVQVERSIEITELAELKLDVSDFVAESDPDGLSVFVEVVDPAQDTDQSYELFVDDDGTYRFGPASN